MNSKLQGPAQFCGDRWLAGNLVCPRDHECLHDHGDSLICQEGHVYPYVDGIPVMLLEDAEPTHGVFRDTLRRTKPHASLSYNEQSTRNSGIDPFVQKMIAATCGIMYQPLIGKLTRYPIPELRLPAARGEVLLDVGCNWGRWCISAAQRGYTAVGVDPSLEAILAARRISRDLGLSVRYVVADARYLPFRNASVNTVFSYSVLQHFSKSNVRLCLSEISRVLPPGGVSKIQMPNAFGGRCLYHRAARQLRKLMRKLTGLRSRPHDTELFEVRYWTPAEMKETFCRLVGPSTLSVDGYFGLGIQATDMDLLPRRYRTVVRVSGILTVLSRRLSLMKYFADSLYVTSVPGSGTPLEM